MSEKYLRTIRPSSVVHFGDKDNAIPPAFKVDVYDVLEAFNIVCPATQHAVKKLLCAGERGSKDRITDLNEAAVAIVRAIQMEQRK